MTDFTQKIGGRKLFLGTLYLAGCFIICGIAVAKGLGGWDALAVGGMAVQIATGLGVVIWGNVQEHRAKNGSAG